MAKHKNNGVPPDVDPDVETVARCVAAGKPVPADVAARLRARAARITEKIRRKFGVVDIGVPAIRELRGELPEP